MANKFKLIYHPIVYIHVPRYVTVCQLRNLALAQICINLLQLNKRGVHIPWGCSQSLCSALRVADFVLLVVVVDHRGQLYVAPC